MYIYGGPIISLLILALGLVTTETSEEEAPSNAQLLHSQIAAVIDRRISASRKVI